MLLQNKILQQLILICCLIPSFQLLGQVQLGNDVVGGTTISQGRTTALSADGRRVATSAMGNGNAGLARVHEYQATTATWVQVGSDIVGATNGEQLGAHLDLSGDGKRIVTLSPDYVHNGYPAGLVRIFQENNGTWTQLGSDIIGQGQKYGYCVSISDDGKRVALGTTNNVVKVFEETALGWLQVGANLTGSGTFGYSVSLSSDGKRLVVGAPYNNAVATSTGQIKIFEESNGVWVPVGNAINGAVNGDYTGYSVSISDDGKRVAFSDYGYQITMEKGRIRVFEENGGVWAQVGVGIEGDNRFDQLGRVVEISGDGKRFIASSRANENAGTNAGHAKVYQENNGTWTQLGADINGLPHGRAGTAAAISSDGHTVGVGSLYFNGTGRVRVFGMPILPACVEARNISAHYCKRRVALLEPTNEVHTNEIVLEINSQGTIPTGAACIGASATWTHFNIKTESFPATGPMTTPMLQETLNNVAIGDLYQITGSTGLYYNLPNTAVAQNLQLGSRSGLYRLKVTLTGVNGTTISDHSTEYILTVSPSFIYKCTSPSTNPGPISN